MMRRSGFLAAVVLVVAVAAGAVQAAPRVVYGIQDDAWIEYGSGTVEQRVATLQRLGLDLVRVTVRWDVVEPTQGTFDWTHADAVLEPLEAAGVNALVTLYGTPRWANGGRAANVAPLRGADFARFAGAVAGRYPSVRRWAIWNEPNQRRWLASASPAQYVTKLLNPAYVAIHSASPSSRVAGGVTAPRGGAGGLSPVAFIRAMGRLNARLDAYAHHPYALARGETPWGGGCAHCGTITMSTITRLVSETDSAFGPVRLWLTELGYQSNPPDPLAGVPLGVQASYIAAAAYLAWATPRVDVLIQYLYRDEPSIGYWQSGLETTAGRRKPAMAAVEAPLAQVRRVGSRMEVWGAIRRGSGVRVYRLQRWSGTAWTSVGGARQTRADGTIGRAVQAAPGAKFRLIAAGVSGNVLIVR